MADILWMLSIGCLVLAVLSLVFGVVYFFAMDIKNVYRELKGRAPLTREQKKQIKRKKVTGESPTIVQHEEPTLIEDEAPTILENGEIDLDSLVGVYKPGTDLLDRAISHYQEEPTDLVEVGEMTEVATVAESPPQSNQEELEESTDLSPAKGQFVIKQEILLINTNLALYQLISQ